MNVRSLILSAIFTICAFVAVTYTACVKDACKDVICQNNGTCVDGSCKCPSGYAGASCETITDPCVKVQCKNEGKCENGVCNCPPGFEGELCEQLSITKYFGVWKGTDSCMSGTYDIDSLVISGSPASNKSATISNPAGAGHQFSLTGELTEANVLTIPAQQLATGISMKGSIVFGSAGSMQFHYSIQGTTSDSCRGTYTKP